jgi:PTS system mannitol-specific IIA component/PTS system ascorbate-specific IIA component
MKFLEENIVSLHAKAATPVEAIVQAGSLLQKQGYVSGAYVDAMINSYRKNGPYFVLAPQIALPHARPEDGVYEASVSMVQLAEPVSFGNSANDPVRLVFALGASNSEEHLAVLKKLMDLLSDRKRVESLIAASSYKDIETLIRKGGEEG